VNRSRRGLVKERREDEKQVKKREEEKKNRSGREQVKKRTGQEEREENRSGRERREEIGQGESRWEQHTDNSNNIKNSEFTDLKVCRSKKCEGVRTSEGGRIRKKTRKKQGKDEGRQQQHQQFAEFTTDFRKTVRVEHHAVTGKTKGTVPRSREET
jgi:hypothetical protein